ncbi:hypothetical protein E2C01_051190 [Portunus trituberculatus]|uniref:Uncharacterized protein n=1 Tax=Portunus trituberculatus TaxID=210409 RepID=A0A5B7GL31_PORTR|nr:hypothetical protein [Portunus trituberculatus]
MMTYNFINCMEKIDRQDLESLTEDGEKASVSGSSIFHIG